MKCPRCGSENVLVQSVQTGSVSSGKIGVQESKKQKGCLYWCCCGWLFDLLWFVCIGWWTKLAFGWERGSKGRIKERTINETRATCQNCGHTWKV